MATHSSTLAWKNPMDGGAWQAAVHEVAKSPTGLNDFTFTFHFHTLEKEMATHSSVLVCRIPGTEGLVGGRLWGRTESDTTEATQQQQKQERNKRKHKKEGLFFTIQTIFTRFSYSCIISQGSTFLKTMGIIVYSMNNQFSHSPKWFLTCERWKEHTATTGKAC